MPVVSLPTPDAVEFVGPLPAEFDVVMWDGWGERPARADEIEVFVSRYNWPPPTAEVLAGLPKLRVVQVTAAGVDSWLPVVPAGVTLCNGRGVHGASTAELAVGGLIALLRELFDFEQARREHRWLSSITEGVTGRRVLVLGAGDIGIRIATALRAFDADVTVAARTARADVRSIDELPALLPEQDVVVLALPLTADTTRLVDAEFLAALPDGAVVVNVARGPVVDTEALLAELTSGRLRAVLDVTDPEPLPPDHPLWDAPNLLLTPHRGGGTRGWERRAYGLVRAQLLRYQAGEPLQNVVTQGY